jgi:hypothetical protein
MAPFRFKIPDAAFEAALPPARSNILALPGPVQVASFSQYAAQVGCAGGLDDAPLLSRGDLDSHGQVLDAAALRAIGRGVRERPLPRSPQDPYTTAFTPMPEKSPRLPRLGRGSDLTADLAAEAAPPAAPPVDGDAAAASARDGGGSGGGGVGSGGGGRRAVASPVPTSEQITETLAQAEITRSALAFLSTAYSTFPRTLAAWRRLLVGEGVMLDVPALRELPAYVLATVASGLSNSWHAGCAARRAILRAAPAGGKGGARLADMFASVPSWDSALARAVRALPDPPPPSGIPGELFLDLVDLPIGRLTIAVIEEEAICVAGGAQDDLVRAAEALVVARGERLVLEGLTALVVAVDSADASLEDIDYKVATRVVMHKIFEARDVTFHYGTGEHAHSWARLAHDTHAQWKLAVESRPAAELSVDRVRGMLDNLSFVARALAQVEADMDRLGHGVGRAHVAAPAPAPPAPIPPLDPATAPAPALTAPNPALDAALAGINQLTQLVAAAFAVNAAGAPGPDGTPPRRSRTGNGSRAGLGGEGSRGPPVT